MRRVPANRWQRANLNLRTRWPRLFRRFIVKWIDVPAEGKGA